MQIPGLLGSLQTERTLTVWVIFTLLLTKGEYKKPVLNVLLSFSWDYIKILLLVHLLNHSWMQFCGDTIYTFLSVMMAFFNSGLWVKSSAQVPLHLLILQMNRSSVGRSQCPLKIPLQSRGCLGGMGIRISPVERAVSDVPAIQPHV